MDAITDVPVPTNEPVHGYAPATPERARLEARLKELASDHVELTATIDGEHRMGGGERIDAVMPHNRHHVLGTMANSTHDDARAATAAAKKAAPQWRAMPFDERAAIILKAADLLSGPWRDTINAATMLGQSKTIHQAEIEAACELIDFWRFNVAFARELMADQPRSVPGVWNRMDYRPLEGFVYAVTPFNFTAIAANLPTAPALMGNVALWKPAPTQQFSAHFVIRLLEEAGMPPGVINMLPGDGRAVSEVALADPDLAGVHFTGSIATFQHLWREVGSNIERYHSYPRIVGETGGKDFIVAHPSADAAALKTALTRGAFEYQGQKCSAASRAYIPASLWNELEDDFLVEVESLAMGDVSDLANFMGAVIDDRSFAKLARVIDEAAQDPELEILAGGQYDDSQGYFVRPTVIRGTNPEHDVFRTEYFGPVIAVYVYDDANYDQVVRRAADAAPYGLTGSIFARDRSVITEAQQVLRFAAGNFYINDKPTGSIVSQQPFGGARGSGTNDKAGSKQNLLRWVSPRAIKESFVPPTDYRYPHMG